ncbi:MAG: hypothetical protein C6I00_06050 [Nitratiruptor sp.]|nr:hypothetical protein [Nitratiruptor sp.]NPA83005.1 hypothetical protein [Campylobacterota bacterium]
MAGHIDTGWRDPELEEFIVVDEAGLQELKRAIEKLDQGETLVRFEGVEGLEGIKLVPPQWFQEPEESPSPWYEQLTVALVVLFFLSSLAIGMAQIVSWIYHRIVP